MLSGATPRESRRSHTHLVIMGGPHMKYLMSSGASWFLRYVSFITLWTKPAVYFTPAASAAGSGRSRARWKWKFGKSFSISAKSSR